MITWQCRGCSTMVGTDFLPADPAKRYCVDCIRTSRVISKPEVWEIQSEERHLMSIDLTSGVVISFPEARVDVSSRYPMIRCHSCVQDITHGHIVDGRNWDRAKRDPHHMLPRLFKATENATDYPHDHHRHLWRCHRRNCGELHIVRSLIPECPDCQAMLAMTIDHVDTDHCNGCGWRGNAHPRTQALSEYIPF